MQQLLTGEVYAYFHVNFRVITIKNKSTNYAQERLIHEICLALAGRAATSDFLCTPFTVRLCMCLFACLFAAYLCILLDQLGKLLGWVALANQSCPGCAGCPFLIFEKSFLLTQQVCSIVGGSSGTGTSLD